MAYDPGAVRITRIARYRARGLDDETLPVLVVRPAQACRCVVIDAAADGGAEAREPAFLRQRRVEPRELVPVVGPDRPDRTGGGGRSLC